MPHDLSWERDHGGDAKRNADGSWTYPDGETYSSDEVDTWRADPKNGLVGHWNPDGTWTNPDGTTESLATSQANKDLHDASLADPKSAVAQGAKTSAEDPGYRGPGDTHANGFFDLTGGTRGIFQKDAPGAELDTTQSDVERSRLGGLLSGLQNQATTGDGAWQAALDKSTGQANSAAQALGQSQPGVGVQSALRNIGNAQGANTQRAVGQADTLRAKSMLDAQGQLGTALQGQGEQDIGQAAGVAGARQGVREGNASIMSQNQQNNKDFISGVGQAVTTIAKASDGGAVPGRPSVFGDDEKNDTVPAMLSPGEIVIPRSHSGSPEAAADFVRAVHAKHGRASHFADGGAAGDAPPDSTATTNVTSGLGGWEGGPRQEAASVKNGGRLDTTNFDQNRTNSDALAQMLGQQANGAGPSVAPTQMQGTVDSQIADAMRAQSGVGAQGRAAQAGDVVAGASENLQKGAGNAAATAAGEQSAGQKAAIQQALHRRSLELALAQAQQQAQWRNSQLNSGISLADQQALKSLVGGAGQVAASFATSAGKDSGSGAPAQNTPAFPDAVGGDTYTYPGDTSGGEPSKLGSPDDKWAGGEIKTKKDTRGADFVRALAKRKSA